MTTGPMNLRHNGHKQEIKSKSTPLGRHFAVCGIGNFSLQIIDCVNHGEDEALLIIEGMWADRLASFEIHGNINVRHEVK